MKLNSAFAAKCPGCRRALPGNVWTGEVDGPWDCLACASPVCVWCYGVHTARCCPNLHVKP